MDKYLKAVDAIKLFKQNALGGKKVPHGVSNPVFRKNENGDYVISAFIYLFTADELRNRNIKRPSKWMTLDMKADNTVTEYDCRENDFCDLPAGTMCDLNAENDTKYSAEYVNQTMAIFDLIVKKYMLTGKFDKELNDAYMYMMLNMVSVGFKEIYKNLNKV